MATTRRYLDISTNSSLTLFEGDLSMTPININCLDPLGRSALLIGKKKSSNSLMLFSMIDEYSYGTFFLLPSSFPAIEYENIEMIELLLSYNVDTTEALLFAIDEQFVEGKIAFLSSEKNLLFSF